MSAADPLPVAARRLEGQAGRRLARRLAERLMAWYREHRRDLPWRRTRDPWAILVSEAMLQQTRVETARPYFERFLERFPDPASLARAPLDEVLRLWSGLGYYRRARSLQAAASRLAARPDGGFPSTREGWLELPGVGAYTAGAVLSIAFDAPEALVDGNVERVFARLFGLESEGSELSRECWSLARRLVPRGDGAGEWNQALMELGATVCRPRRPSCESCPVRRSCSARASDRVEDLPRSRAPSPVVLVELEILLVERAGAWLVERRPPAGRMAGLWQFPTRERGERGSGLFPARWLGGLGPRPLIAGERVGELRHTITRHRILATVRRGRPGAAFDERSSAACAWLSEDGLEECALTGMARKVRRRFLGGTGDR